LGNGNEKKKPSPEWEKGGVSRSSWHRKKGERKLPLKESLDPWS